MIEAWFIFTTPRIPYTVRKVYGRRRTFARGCETASSLEEARDLVPRHRGLVCYQPRWIDPDLIEVWIPRSTVSALRAAKKQQ